jgi:hypothetical protein
MSPLNAPTKKNASAIKNSVLDACLRFMRPLARFLVRSGVGFREFSEVAKIAFVDVVSSDYGIRGRLANISRVAVRTGLTRKEVSRIRHQGKREGGGRPAPVGRPERVLEAWHRMPEFCDESGKPKRLPFDGETSSFVALLRLVGGDIPPKAMLKELVNAGSVKEDSHGCFSIVSRSFIPDASDPDSVVLAGEALHDLVTTINHNLFESGSHGKRLERRVYGDLLSAAESQQFQKIAAGDAEELLERLNTWISEREGNRTAVKDQGKKKRIGLGIYLFEEDYDS